VIPGAVRKKLKEWILEKKKERDRWNEQTSEAVST